MLDFGGNVVRHGPVDKLTVKDRTAGKSIGEAPAKECPNCRSVIAVTYSTCPDCGHPFPPPQREQHEATAADAGVLSGQITTTQYAVHDVFYSVHVKRGADDDDPRTMRVDYKVGWHEYKSEWVCFEHTGYARQKAIAWWRRRSPDPVPDTAERAVELAECGALAAAHSITVRSVSPTSARSNTRTRSTTASTKPSCPDELFHQAQTLLQRNGHTGGRAVRNQHGALQTLRISGECYRKTKSPSELTRVSL